EKKVQVAARNTSCSLSYPPRSVAPEDCFLHLVSYESAGEAQGTAHPSPGIFKDATNTRGRTDARRHHRRDTRKTSPTPPFRPRLATTQRLPVSEKHTSTEKARVEGAVCLRIESILEQKRKTLPL
ncbi:unnamed protein product, partial [Ectocarpus sp. 12 AP-2014]